MPVCIVAKVPFSFVISPSVRPSVLRHLLGSLWTDFPEIWHLRLSVKLSWETSVKLGQKYGALYMQTWVSVYYWLITYLLTPWSRVLLEKLTGSQLVKKFPTFYRTRSFIPAFTSVRHMSLSRAREYNHFLLNSFQFVIHESCDHFAQHNSDLL